MTVHREAIQQVASTSEKSSEKTEDVILYLLKINPKMTIKDLSDEIGITPRAIEKQLAKLKDTKRLKRVGPDKGGYWKVIK